MKLSNLRLQCEAQVSLAQDANEAQQPSGRLEARVTTWGAREGADGRKFNYQPEGFAQWAEAFANENKALPMFLNHNDMGMPMGEWTSFEFDDTGMTAEGRLYLNTQGGKDLYTVLKESPNMFGGVSVGAYAEEACWVDAEGNMLDTDSMPAEADAYFQITKGGLREVSVVMYPNNPEADIMKLECFDEKGHINPRVLEKLLREAGVAKKDATTASSVFKRVLEKRDAPKKVEVTPQQSDSGAVVKPEAKEEFDAGALLEAFAHRELAKALEKRIK
jgi:HK97 family phage prohead protease